MIKDIKSAAILVAVIAVAIVVADFAQRKISEIA